MKNLVRLLGVFSIVLFTLTSCSKDDDPKDNDLFIGTYKGRVSYTKGLKNISNDNGKVTVSKVGDNYTFSFSNDIPSIKDVKIEKGKNSFKLEWKEASIITIDQSNLNISMAKDGQLWTANCKR